MKAARVRHLATTLLMATMLGGCGAIDFDKMEREEYQHACDNLGIARGTPTYDQCMLQQQAIRDSDTQKMLDREAMQKHRH
ncbi:MAG: hypothetical protein QHC78_03690 [Pigmentiphaga sp.]|uniref:hypothetical protein n=1 Tax=Pigmentiphaga sp. TaxID=1977564 RepID=UPI0029A08804|nr:hypothetical protein [Pigmentiphaga sp.]MDX3904774.1 hypothetical protein [Pigmentiphaga sp.]